jgi:hypothetical protein
VEAVVLVNRPKRILIAAGRSAEEARQAWLRRAPGIVPGIGVAFYRCTGSNLGVPDEEGLLLASYPDAAPVQPLEMLGSEAPTLLVRCPAPARGGFAALSTDRSSAAPVTGMVAVCSILPESRHQGAFSRWYNHHIGIVLQHGVFHTAHRYVTAEPQSDGLRRHWAFYETDRDDAAGFLPGYVLRRRREEGSIPNVYPPYVRVLGSTVYERLPL